MGIPSWDWYYPCNYAPFSSDLLHNEGLNIAFDLGEPVSPLTHLLAILPMESNGLLPQTYREAMQEKLREFYPSNFESDLNGKLRDWEAVVVLPHICKVLLFGIRFWRGPPLILPFF